MINGKAQLIVVPSEEEDAAITAAALSDPDAQPLTDEELDEFTPVRRRGRPAKEVPKIRTTIRLDIEVLDSFKSMGDGWQTKINNVLLEYLVDNKLVMHRFKAVIADYECLVLAKDSIQAKDKMKQHLRETGRSARGRIVVDLAFGASKDLPLIP
ncbi:MAG: BrnA antitoxin family protein [Burkholderiaceae bacterium]|nr:BrnA antitoxin family protein [Burkholderiaceae bacterium]